jgi:hypothetical protein
MTSEPTIICPKCKTEIKLTESLAAPLVESVRRDYEDRLAQKDAAMAARETALRERETVIAKAKESLDDKVAEKVKQERARIVAEEGKKARLALSADLDQKSRELAELQETLAQRDRKLAEAQQAQADLRKKQRELEDARREVELTVENRVQAGITSVRDQVRKEAEGRLTREVQQREQTIAEMGDKLAEAQKAQAELIRKQRELDDARREMDLTVEKRVQESLAGARDQARKEAEDSLRLKVAEKEQTIAGMQKQIEDLKRRAEQGSQQLQGEVQELELEALLRGKFPRDTIEPVPKGEHGGDVLQRVVGPLGQVCGTILWESKRTKNWSDAWLVKLREDQRAAKAEVAVLVTQALPKQMETFDLVDGVWVTPPRTALPIAMALRQMLTEVSLARQSSEGQQTKMEMVYQYLTGPRFRQRVEAIVEAFTCMREELETEKKVIQKQWAKREQQAERVLQATVGMYGDLQGIAGKTLQEIEGLEMKALQAPDV